MKVTIIGAGYVGLTTAIGLAMADNNVTCIEKDPHKLTLLSQGKPPIKERYMDDLLAQVAGEMNFVASVDHHLGDSEVIMIAVGTPATDNGEANIVHVEEAARQAALGMLPDKEYTLVVKSTVPIGTNRRVAHVVDKTLARRGVSARVQLASNPEFLREGTAITDMLYPERIVVGTESPDAAAKLRQLYDPILTRSFTQPANLIEFSERSLPEFIVTDTATAEMIKYAANAFLALKVSFINEIAGFCECVGADIKEVARGIGSDSRIGHQFLAAGLGWGGSCLPKDTAALLAVASEHGYQMPIVQAARAVNARQRQTVIDRLQQALRGLRGRTIGILGVAFKPNTDDVRESPALDIVRGLLDRGAQVRVHDPLALDNARQLLDHPDVEFVTDPYDLAAGCDGLLLATDWSEYRTLDLHHLASRMHTRVLVDGRNLFDPDRAIEAGFTYIGIGRGSVSYAPGVPSTH